MILILDDHPLARQGLCSLIEMYRKGEKILQAATVRESIRIMETEEVSLAFVDLNLGGESGFSFLSWVKDHACSAKIFVITSSSRQSDFCRAQDLGVDAYVLKDAFIDEILYGLKTVERGGKFYSAALVERMNSRSEDEKTLQALTDRELEVLLLLGRGMSNASISQTLYISEGTTKKHISSILSKLHIRNRVEAVLLANKNSYSVQISLSRGIKPDLRRKAEAI